MKNIQKINRALIFSLSSLFLSVTMQAQSLALHVNKVNNIDNSSSKRSQSSTVEKVDYNLWEVLLKKNVNAKGVVNYKAFKNDGEKLNDFLRQLSRTKINYTWKKEDKIAFWINVYNCLLYTSPSPRDRG